MTSKLNDNYGNKIENYINLTTTIKHLREERMNKSEYKMTELIAKNDKILNELGEKFAKIEISITNMKKIT